MSIDTRPTRRATRPAARALTAATLLAAALATAGPAASPADAAVKAPKKKADVVVTRVGSAPTTARPGTTFVLPVGVRNRGKATARPTGVVVRMSRDATATASDPAIGSARTPRLRPGRSGQVASRVTVPRTAAAATYRLFVCTPRRCTPAGPVRVLGRSTPPTPTPGQGALSGRLHGDLYLRDAGDVADGQHRDRWQHDAHVSIQMVLSGRGAGDADFASTGSTWSYTGTAKETGPNGDCQQVVDETRRGGGTLAWNDDPDRDEVFASVARTDLSELSLVTSMRYDSGISDVSTGPWYCAHDEHTTRAARDISDMDLTEISRAGSAITYRVTAIRADYNTASDWDQVDGTLTLDLD